MIKNKMEPHKYSYLGLFYFSMVFSVVSFAIVTQAQQQNYIVSWFSKRKKDAVKKEKESCKYGDA